MVAMAQEFEPATEETYSLVPSRVGETRLVVRGQSAVAKSVSARRPLAGASSENTRAFSRQCSYHDICDPHFFDLMTNAAGIGPQLAGPQIADALASRFDPHRQYGLLCVVPEMLRNTEQVPPPERRHLILRCCR